MSKESEDLLAKALRLPQSARAALAGKLMASLDEEIDPSADDAWRVEIARRVQALDEGKGHTIPWSEVERRLVAMMDEPEDP